MTEAERRRQIRIVIIVTVAMVVGIAGGGIAAALARSSGSSSGSSAYDAKIAWMQPTLRSQIGLVGVDRKTAPSFTLVDQKGRTVSLAALKGRPVVLDFMDPKCTDICPIVSQEYLLAVKQLGAKARDVAFLAVNVNQYHEKVADVAGFSRAHRLSTISTWHFLTGSTPALKKVWHDYGVYVEPNKTGDVVHSSNLYFIGRDGKMQYAATPTNKKSGIPTWGRGIAAVAAHLLDS